jgi:hypothetical protein
MFAQTTKNVANKIAVLGSLSALCLGITGCTPYANTPNETSAPNDRLTPTEREQTKASRLAEVRDIGAGIFVFPRDAHFPETLSDFRQVHPELRIISVAQSADTTVGVLDQTDSRANSQIVVVETNQTFRAEASNR